LEKVIAEGDRRKDIMLEPGDVFFGKEKISMVIFDRYFIGGILPVTGFIGLIDRLTKD